MYPGASFVVAAAVSLVFVIVPRRDAQLNDFERTMRFMMLTWLAWHGHLLEWRAIACGRILEFAWGNPTQLSQGQTHTNIFSPTTST
eukprot:6011976-Amphidinium_carterae.1